MQQAARVSATTLYRCGCPVTSGQDHFKRFATIATIERAEQSEELNRQDAKGVGGVKINI